MGQLHRHAVIVLAVVGCAVICPLAVAAQTQDSVLLRAGHIGRYEWSAFVERPERSKERRAGIVCLTLSMLEPSGTTTAEGNSVTGCAAPPEMRPYLEHLHGGTERKTRVVFTVLFPAEVQRVRLRVRGEGVRTIRAGHVTLPAEDEAGDAHFAFIADGSSQSVCVQQIIGLDRNGKAIASLGRQACL